MNVPTERIANWPLLSVEIGRDISLGKGLEVGFGLTRCNRRSIRLRGYDYSWPGWYYVTICTLSRKRWFGDIVGNEVRLSPLGEKAQEFWRQIPNHNRGIELDEFVVMPDHLHGIIIINSNCQHLRGDVPIRGDVQLNVPTKWYSRISPKKGSLSVIIRTFKGAVVTWARQAGYVSFHWQGRFYEHIIRNDADLRRIRQYIHNNPLRWSMNEKNPQRRRDISEI